MTRRAALCLLALAALPGPAGAYLLPPNARLRFAARALAKGRATRLRLAGEGVFSGRAVRVDADWRLEGEAQFAARGSGGARARATGAERVEGDAQLLPPAPARAALAALLGAGYPGRAAQLLGVDLRVHRLALLGDHVVHALGDEAALWLDQESHLPLRLQGPGFSLDLLAWGPGRGGLGPAQVVLITAAGRLNLQRAPA